MRPKAQFAVHQCARFSANPNLPHDQAVKHVMKYLKGTATKLLIMKPNPEKGIQIYLDIDSVVVCNQEEGKDPGLVILYG